MICVLLAMAETQTHEASSLATNTTRKKINKMSLAELNTALKRTEECMKGLSSKYAKTLLARKSILEGK